MERFKGELDAQMKVVDEDLKVLTDSLAIYCEVAEKLHNIKEKEMQNFLLLLSKFTHQIWEDYNVLRAIAREN